MSEKRFKLDVRMDMPKLLIDNNTNERYNLLMVNDIEKIVDVLNEQQEFIEELEVSDEMGWKRAEYFEKKCPKELHNKKMYIKRLEYKVQKFKEMNSEQQDTINKLKEELKLEQDFASRWQKESEMLAKENEDLREVNKENQRLHEENVKQCERWRSLYELKDAEVTARVDALNKVCEYYTSEVLFKSDVDPNRAVKEVINEILNTEVEM